MTQPAETVRGGIPSQTANLHVVADLRRRER